MNKSLYILLLSFSFIFIGCEEETGKVQPEKIDQAADEVKDGLDDLVGNAKKFLDGDGPDKLKGLIDDLAEKGKKMGNDGEIWKAKMEKIKDDPDIQKLVEKLKTEGKDLGDKMERLGKEIENDADLKAKLDDIDNLDDLYAFAKKYEGEGKETLLELESTLRELDESGIIQKKIEELKNDEDFKKLLKKYEQDGKEIIEQLEDIFNKAQ